jgi:cytochrome c-type biogenesis protein CcmH
MRIKRFSWIFLALILAAFLGLIPGQPGQAQDNPPRPIDEISDNEVNAIAKQLYCPVCENIPLDVCPTQACAEWRDLIRLRISEGWSADRIKEYFAQQYGERVLAAPPARGLNWLVYIVPPLIILAGAYVLYRAFRSWKTSTPQTTEGISSGEPALGEDEYASRIEEELKKLES